MEKTKWMSRNGCYDGFECKGKDCRSCGGKPFRKLIGGRPPKEFHRRLRRQDSTLQRMLLAFYNSSRGNQRLVVEEV